MQTKTEEEGDNNDILLAHTKTIIDHHHNYDIHARWML